MLTPGLFVWNQFITVPDDATEIEIVGQQWQWSFRLPGEDGRLGSAGTHHITDTNPLGLNPDDPDGRDDIVVQGSELRLRSEEHTSELQSLMRISYAVFCLKKKT